MFLCLLYYVYKDRETEFLLDLNTNIRRYNTMKNTKNKTKKAFNRKDYYSAPDLKSKFGMTETIIKKMKVTVERPNPYARCTGYPMRFYSKSYVARFFKTKRFLEWKADHDKRATGVAKMKATVRAKSQARLNAGLSSLTLYITPDRLEAAVRAAIDEKKQFEQARDDFYGYFDYNPKSIEAARLEVKHRWVVNYIRHNKSNYEQIYTTLTRNDHDSVKDEINDMIEQLLPGIDDAIIRVFPNTPITEVK